MVIAAGPASPGLNSPKYRHFPRRFLFRNFNSHGMFVQRAAVQLESVKEEAQAGCWPTGRPWTSVVLRIDQIELKPSYDLG